MLLALPINYSIILLIYYKIVVVMLHIGGF